VDGGYDLEPNRLKLWTVLTPTCTATKLAMGSRSILSDSLLAVRHDESFAAEVVYIRASLRLLPAHAEGRKKANIVAVQDTSLMVGAPQSDQKSSKSEWLSRYAGFYGHSAYYQDQTNCKTA